MLTRADSQVQSWADLMGKTVRYSPTERFAVKSIRWPPGISLELDTSQAEALRHVCQKDGVGVWSAAHVLRSLALMRPPGCEGVDLAIFQPPQAAVSYSLGANKRRAHEAGRLRDAIEDLHREGRTMELAARWHILELAHWDLIDRMVASNRQNIHLFYGLTATALICLVLAWFAARARVGRVAAERVSAARSQFLANMSHELRTPMNGVLGIIDLVLSSKLSNEQREQLLLARTSARSLLGVLNDILDFSRIDSGKLVLERIPFSPREVAERSVRLMATKAHAKRLELLFETDASVPSRVLGDPVRLQQVLLNLLGNAVKFTSSGSIRLALWAQPEAGQVRLTCEVSDTGIGIPREKQTAIFDSFTQADDSVTRRFGGSGLGLSICSRLATLMSGSLEVFSEEGHGSRFLVHLSFGSCPDQEAASAALTSLSGRRALVVDDSPEHLAQLQKWLNHWRVEATTLPSAAAAITSLQEGQCYDFVLIDTRLAAWEDGFAAAARLAELAGRERLILLLETLDLAGDAARCRQIGVNYYLTKPFTDQELRQRLESMATHQVEQPHGLAELVPAAARALSILVAEDNRINQLVTRKLLEKAGHRVTVVDNGLEALEAAGTHTFDLALFDMQMPEMGGVEAVMELRRRESQTRRARLPVIAVTAHALTGDRERFLQAGIDDYLAKPIDAASLLGMVDAIAAQSVKSA